MKQFFTILFLICTYLLYAVTINIPADQPTIQAGITAATNTDTVLVQPGTYFENINYNGKNITVASLFLTTQDSTYISSTIIDGNNNGTVVTFENGENSSATLCGFTITNGHASDGGGIRCSSSSSPTLKNVRISDNYAFENGGGISCFQNSNPSLENVTISNNTSIQRGGGIHCGSYSSPSLENVSISGNSVAWWGGGISCSGVSNPSLENVTISDNIANITGGGIYCRQSNPIITNSILWNDFQQEIYYEFGMVVVTYSDIEGGWTGEGNIDSDPLFEDPFNGNYHLTENSPCIDAGDPTSPLDPDGTISDMGAFYFDQLNAIDDNEIPISEFNLSNHPNPFNPVTNIQFDIKENETGVITIFNIKGQLIESHRFESGKHNYLWDASEQSSGIYLYKLQTQSITETRKMILLK